MRQVELDIESWPLLEPFVITGHTWTHCDVMVVSITENGVTGRGEATGVYYLDETAESMYQQALGIQQKLEQGISREQLQSLLPAGGARNAIILEYWRMKEKIEFFNGEPGIIDNYPIIEAKDLKLKWVDKAKQDHQNLVKTGADKIPGYNHIFMQHLTSNVA